MDSPSFPRKIVAVLNPPHKPNHPKKSAVLRRSVFVFEIHTTVALLTHGQSK